MFSDLVPHEGWEASKVDLISPSQDSIDTVYKLITSTGSEICRQTIPKPSELIGVCTKMSQILKRDTQRVSQCAWQYCPKGNTQ